MVNLAEENQRWDSKEYCQNWARNWQKPGNDFGGEDPHFLLPTPWAWLPDWAWGPLGPLCPLPSGLGSTDITVLTSSWAGICLKAFFMEDIPPLSRGL